MLSICFSILIQTSGFAQEAEYAFKDPEEFLNFLENQGEITGLKSFLLIPHQEIQQDSISQFFTAEGENLKSQSFGSIDSTLSLLNYLELPVDSDYLVFKIYQENGDLATAQEFVTNLLNSELLFPKGASDQRDYIGLASRQPYEPAFREGFGFFTNFKVFLITAITAILFVVVFGMIVFMLIFKSRINKTDQLRKEYEGQIANPLSVILFERDLGEIESISDEELFTFFPKEKMKKKLYQKVLVDQILRLNKKLRGESNDKLKALFRRLGLPKTTSKLLQDSQWDSKVSALVQINEMALYEFLPEVKKFVNSPNFYIRSQVSTTLIHLSEEVDLSFLKDMSYPLSDWQQVTLLRTIKYSYSDRSLRIKTLFNSQNQSVRLFGIKLVRHLGKLEYLEQLIGLVPTASPVEQIEIIETFQQLGAPLDMELIVSFMNSSVADVRLAMARALGTVGDESCLPFLYKGLEEEVSFDMKKAMLSSMKTLSQGGYEEYGIISDDPEVLKIQRHLDNKILTHV
ncbi:hypothetical protein ACFOSV_12785 [Algoriphagus namhaensis]|uniref:HEAT repeat domain-containing protein n=1 Tax=Algoriphagus namhaensis TaxID=915353 RepID=A0ABV8ATV4_9BACT